MNGFRVEGGGADVLLFLGLWHRATQDGVEEGGDGIRRG